MTVPTTCCGRSDAACVCQSKATCSCGKQAALQCNCDKAATENKVQGARCSCRESTPLCLFSFSDSNALFPFQIPPFLFRNTLLRLFEDLGKEMEML